MYKTELNDIWTELQHLDFHAYLDLTTLKNLTRTCNVVFTSISPHIEKEYTFSTPLFSMEEVPYKPFLKFYKNARKFTNFHDIYHIDIPSKALYFLYPPSITHLTTYYELPINLSSWTSLIKLHRKVDKTNKDPILSTSECGVLDYLVPSNPPHLTHLQSDKGMDKSIDFSKSLTHLKLYDYLKEFRLPQSLKFLEISRVFQGDADWLPISLTYLKLGGQFNHEVDYLPEYLTHLELGPIFNQAVDNLPKSLLYLKIGDNDYKCNFRQKIDNLPQSLTHLRIGQIYSFSHEINHLPQSLTYLQIGSFNGNNFPNSLKCIKFMDTFHNSLDLQLPQSLKKLTLSCSSDQEGISLPPSLTYLDLKYEFKKSIRFPHTLTHLIWKIESIIGLTEFEESEGWLDNLPDSLTHLSLGSLYLNTLIDYLPQTLKCLLLLEFAIFNLSIDYLPSTLTKLQLSENFNQNVDYLPQSLQHLEFGFSFNQNVDHLPQFVTKIIFRAKFNQCIDYLPPSLAYLQVVGEFNKPIDNLPSLQSLIVCGDFDHPVDNLPPQLQYLALGDKFNQPVDHLPSSLVSISLGLGEPFDWPFDHLPPYLTKLEIRFYRRDKKNKASFHWLPEFLTHLEIDKMAECTSNLRYLSGCIDRK